MTPADDPRWPRASAWLAGDHNPEPVGSLAVLGVPLHLASITPGRCDLAPAAIREALAGFSTWTGNGDLRSLAASDLGDLDLAGAAPEEALEPVAGALGNLSADAVVLLGGDNSVTRPGMHAVAAPLSGAGLLTLDAHLDLRDTAGGLSNGNPVRALLEDGLPGEHVVQVGIQPFANSSASAQVAREAGITVVPVEEVRARGIEAVVGEALDRLPGTIYVDVDVDALDRAHAPGAPGSRPGGLTPRELFLAVRICGAHPKVPAMDIVEVDPTKDVADVTVLAAAKCLLSFAAGVLARKEGG